MADSRYSGDALFTDAQKTIIENFVKKGALKAQGYAYDAENDRYTKNENTYSLDDAYQTSAPTLAFASDEVTVGLYNDKTLAATPSVDFGLYVKYASDNTSVVEVGEDGVLTIKSTGTANITANMVGATDTVAVTIPAPTTLTGQTIIDKANSNGIITDLDMSSVDKIYDVTSGKTNVEYDAANNKLGVTVASGERRFAALVGDASYIVNAVVSDCVITTAAQFKTYYTGSDFGTAGYYAVLGDNVTLSPSESLSPSVGFYSTFDGLGYTVTDAYLWGGWASVKEMQNGSQIKNVTFDNFLLRAYGLFGRYSKGGTIENVTINTSLSTYDFSHRSILLSEQPNGSVMNFKDVAINISAISDYKFKLYNSAGSRYVVMNNVKIAAPGIDILKAGETDSDGSTIFVPANLASYWTDSSIKDRADLEIIEEYSLVSDGKITTTKGDEVTVSTTRGKNSYIINNSSDGLYLFTTTVADGAIMNATEFETYYKGAAFGTTDYYVLAQDITIPLSDTSWEVTSNFAGTLDGLEHTLTNLFVHYGWSNEPQKGSVLKNITLNNYRNIVFGIFGRYNKGLRVENVTIDYNFEKYNYWNVNRGLFLDQSPTERSAAGAMRLIDVDVTVRGLIVPEEYKFRLYNSANGYYFIYLDNVTVNAPGLHILSAGDADTDGTVYIPSAAASTYWTDSSIKDRSDLEIIRDYSLVANGKITTTKGDEITVSTTRGKNSYLLNNTTDGWYLFTTTIADESISTAEEFEAWYKSTAGTKFENNGFTTTKYFVLTSDITLTSTFWQTHTGAVGNFAGTFDGLGHKISNLYTSYGWCQEPLKGSVLKNVTFDNYKNYVSGLFGLYNKGMFVENVVINYSLDNYNFDFNNGNNSGLLIANSPTERSANAASLNNVTINVTHSNPDAIASRELVLYKSEGAYYWMNMNNVTINATCVNILVPGEAATNGAVYIAETEPTNRGWSGVTITDKTGTVNY